MDRNVAEATMHEQGQPNSTMWPAMMSCETRNNLLSTLQQDEWDMRFSQRSMIPSLPQENMDSMRDSTSTNTSNESRSKISQNFSLLPFAEANNFIYPLLNNEQSGEVQSSTESKSLFNNFQCDLQHDHTTQRDTGRINMVSEAQKTEGSKLFNHDQNLAMPQWSLADFEPKPFPPSEDEIKNDLSYASVEKKNCEMKGSRNRENFEEERKKWRKYDPPS